ncbi:MAG TPA: XTP/dITP diphosphatase, partial [Trichococcus flocculiformis]|nr:XTP/dITP diphosphatase [Trichococcus flocculiformis]
LFEPKGYEVVTLLDYPEIEDVEETGYTFEANARKKAETIAELLGMTVLADDSGICIDALDGQPGVFSARFAGGMKSDAANNAKVLAMLGSQENPSRKAHFHCTLVLAHPDRESLVVEGDIEGEIAEFPSGDYGFGYDPLFYLPHLGKTMAELSDVEKNQISHRAIALKNLEKNWAAWLEKEAD